MIVCVLRRHNVVRLSAGPIYIKRDEKDLALHALPTSKSSPRDGLVSAPFRSSDVRLDSCLSIIHE